MRLLSIVHQTDAGAGVFAEAVAEGGHELEQWVVSESPKPPSPLDAYGAVLVFGGAMHVDQEDRHAWLRDELLLLRRLLADEVPLLGVCLGAQLLAKALDGRVRRLPSPEIGWIDVALTPEAEADPVFAGLPQRFSSFQWHLYHFELPEAAVPLAQSEQCLQAFRAGDAAWAIQFHAEVTHASVSYWVRSSDPAEDGAVDFPRLLGETEERIVDWNAFGRDLCGRFLATAEGGRPTPARPDATTRATSPRS